MKRVYELTEQDIKDAVAVWLESVHGVSGKVEVTLTYDPGCSDQRDYVAPKIAASAVVKS